MIGHVIVARRSREIPLAHSVSQKGPASPPPCRNARYASAIAMSSVFVFWCSFWCHSSRNLHSMPCAARTLVVCECVC